MFKTTGVINRDFYNKIKMFFVPLRIKILWAFVLFFYVFLIVFFFVFHYYARAILFILFTSAGFLLYYWSINKNVSLQVARLKEKTGMDEVECTVYFDDDGVVTEDNSSESSGKLKYYDFKKIVKTQSCYLIISKARLFVPVFVDCLSDEEKNDLLAFIKERAPQTKC